MYHLAILRKKTLKQQACFLGNQYHLCEQRARAKAHNDSDKAAAIMAIVQREYDSMKWKRINRVVRDPHPGALRCEFNEK